MRETMTRGELRVIANTDHVQCGDAAAMANMLLSISADLISAMEEVLRISERDHEAWRRAHAAIADLRSVVPGV